MRPIPLAVTLLFLSLAMPPPPQMALAQNDRASPDFDLAYELATASFCAYTVGQVHKDGGQHRAVQCLQAAAAAPHQDGAQLAAFEKIPPQQVEAFYDPKAPENAYLLIQTEAGVILAFRGTLTPPISPSDGRLLAAGANTDADGAELFKDSFKAWTTFFTDWGNNLDPRAIFAADRHPGFEKAWSGLLDHLMRTECIPACSKFLAFVGPLHNNASRRLYITGHSKGGALAVLAALDLPDRLGHDIVPVVYTFAGAKALTANTAKLHVDDFKDMWRFERAGDLVPSLPPDSTVPSLVAYAHVGNRALFTKGEPPDLSPVPVRTDDSKRLAAAAKTLFASDSQAFDLANLIASLRKLGENNCAALVDSHFLIFADVQEAVRARHAGGPMTITEENLNQSFFYTGLPDAKGEILWGYSQWCRLLTGASTK